MKTVRLVAILFFSLVLMACACSKRGKGGSGLTGASDDTVPGAEAGDILKDVNFAFDSSALTDSSKETLRANAKWMMDNPKATATIEGHCDERGTNEYNMALGERRATSVQSFYKTLGVGAERLSTVSYGEEMPLDPGHNEGAWAKNRRAHHRVK